MDHAPVLILGEVQLVRPDGVVLPLGDQAKRLLLLLALRRGALVAKDTLSEALWEDEGLTGSSVRLRMAVSRLRTRLQKVGLPDAIRFDSDAYCLSIDEESIDAERFAQLVSEARRAAPTRPEQAADLFDQALGLWSGDVFGSLGAEPWAAAEATRLDELRRGAEEDWASIELGRGREGAIIDRLRLATQEAPLRELRWVQLATALYRLGRQAESLRALHEARTLLRDEVGVEPGPDLRRLERAVLEQDSALDDRSPLVPSNVAAPSPIGRDDDLAAIADLVRANRVVTIVGLGGIGKTMLARTLAAEMTEAGAPALFVVLDGLTGTNEVGLAIASAAGFGGGEDHGTLVAAMGGRLQQTSLLVLDGAEASPAAVAAIVDELGAVAPQARILVTARAPIDAVGEVRYTLAPLPTGTIDEPGPGVRLFLARAGIAAAGLDPGAMTAILDICERAAGLPLAIELVASTVDRYGLRGLDAAVERAGAPVRHALEASLDVLPEASRRLLLETALLPDGVSLELAADLSAVATAEVRPIIGPLAQLRLLDVRSDVPGLRYRSLEPVRQAALDLLDTDRAAAEERVMGLLLARTRAVGDVGTIPVLAALPAVEAELGNLRHWLERSVGTEPGLELAIAVTPALEQLGMGGEAGAWLRLHRSALPHPSDLALARSTVALANSGGFGTGPATSIDELERAAEIAETQEAWPLWFLAMSYLALALGWSGNVSEASEMLDGPLAHDRIARFGNDWFETHRLRLLAFGRAVVGGDFAAARADIEGMADRFDALGDASSALTTRYVSASMARQAGDLEQASSDLRSAREHAPVGAGRGILALVDVELAQLARTSGDPNAAALLTEAIADLDRAGNLRMAGIHRRDLGRWRLADDDVRGAMRDLRAALPLLIRIDRRNAAAGLAELANLVAEDRPSDAARLAATARHWAHGAPGPHPSPEDMAIVDETASRLTGSGGDAPTPLEDAEVLRLLGSEDDATGV